VDGMLKIQETFLGFFKMPSTNSDVLLGIIQDVLVQYVLEVNNCHG
jgi:hypothetical protein